MINPLSDRIVVKVIEEKEAKGGIWIPDGANVSKGLAFGKVLAAGPGRTNAGGEVTPMRLKSGDTVVFRPTATDYAIFEGEEILTMYEGDVIGTV